VLLGKVNIPKSDKEINVKTDLGKVLMKNASFNEMSYTEMIVSIEVRRNSCKAVFIITKGCKSRDYTDGNYE
jgi:hypothetical protein